MPFYSGRLWALPNLLSDMYWGFSPGVKRHGHEAVYSPVCLPGMVRNEASEPFPHLKPRAATVHLIPPPVSETAWQELRFGSCVQRVPQLPIVRHLVPFSSRLLSNPRLLSRLVTSAAAVEILFRTVW
jgi:hypothetical protein